MGTPVWQRLLVAALSAILLFEAGAVAPVASLSASTGESDVEPAIEAVAVEYGTSFAGILPDFARANYLLEYDDGFPGGASDVQTVWRDALAPDDQTAADSDGLAPPRPKRARHDMNDGSTAQGAIGLKPGGSAYVDLVPSPRGSTGEMAISIANAPGEIAAHVMTIRYPPPPASPTICIETPVFIDPDGSGLVSVPISDGCEYAVLTVTHTDYNSGDASLDWSAEFTASGTPPTCTENFDRTVAPGGWGQSDFGGAWVSWQVDPDPQASVDGTSGRIFGEWSSRLASEGLALEFPVEVVTRWRFVGPGSAASHYFEIHLQDYDSGRDVSASYSRDIIGGTDFSKTIANHEGAQNVGTAAHAAPDGQWMWMRVHVTDAQTRLRVWPDGDVEPTTWQRTASGPTLPAAPDLITVFANATNANQGVEVDFITLTEGCLVATYADTFDRVVDPASGTTAGWGTGP